VTRGALVGLGVGSSGWFLTSETRWFWAVPILALLCAGIPNGLPVIWSRSSGSRTVNPRSSGKWIPFVCVADRPGAEVRPVGVAAV